ncbi:MAG: flavodoxin-dependent (E)-4-hydroxy-3-methylbut-2-enyl-diphosphate synthase [Candidatus Omnitrophica bacterium]|nr:flavodoxin-dependent (E)-4-hydroxy-3-methylbut-2-enyl-diphosphate synthase [Candidatus Omnitrophota bacterium]
MKRRKAKIVRIGRLTIGGSFPVAVQSMTKTKTADVENTLCQIDELEKAGCEIIRVAVKDEADANALKKIRSATKMPLVADIHFSWRLAIRAIENGVDKIRLNPGNIYKKKEVVSIVSALKSAHIPLRIGVNSGSVSFGSSKDDMSNRLLKSALNYIRMIEKLGFYDIVISLKASGVLETIEAYRGIAHLCDYPLHLGVTATGGHNKGAVKSGIALGVLLLEGIGDTIRVSLTDTPLQEVKVAQVILESVGIRHFGPQIISCPTCGRCQINLTKILSEVEDNLSKIGSLSDRMHKIAIMGCLVNGPGEAREADIGIAFGKKEGLLFKNGKSVRKVSADEVSSVLCREIMEG